jgi:hypothetical protein
MPSKPGHRTAGIDPLPTFLISLGREGMCGKADSKAASSAWGALRDNAFTTTFRATCHLRLLALGGKLRPTSCPALFDP